MASRISQGILMDDHGDNDYWDYRLTRIGIEGATGYYDCVPVAPYDFDAALALGRTRPNDEFMRRYLLRRIGEWEPQAFKRRIREAAADDLFLKALFFEACLLMAPFAAMRRLFSAGVQARLAQATPLVYIKAYRTADHRLHRRWIERLRLNIEQHAPLPAPQAAGLPAPTDAGSISGATTAAVPLERMVESAAPVRPTAYRPIDPAALAASALERLTRAGIKVGPEMRHEASLSPIALLREWEPALRVDCGRHRYRLTGGQIAYGRGLALDHARVACAMEIVERVSAFADIGGGRVLGYRHPYPLRRARLSELHRDGLAALDPNRLGLEAPYRDEPLYWMEGLTPTSHGPRPISIPAQCVFLFCNLDEVKLFSGLGSNGLGAGADPAEAKCKALLEVIERDSAATIPYTPALRFELDTDDARIDRLLQSYARAGIRVGFQDLTGPLGVPCCKSFVVDTEGRIAAGFGAHLNARQALLSALTETPYPFPNGPPSRPLPPADVRVPLEALPDYDCGDPAENLKLLEKLLRANGFEPIYVDLTMTDLDLPVVRAIVPGMDLLGDFGPFSRVHPRLYGNYLKFASGADAGR